MTFNLVAKVFRQSVTSVLGMCFFMASSATWALESPFQLNYPYFEDDRNATNTSLAGKSFQNGFSFSGWFNFRKLPGDPRNLVGFDANSLVLASPGNGDVSLYFNQTEGVFLQIETDQWVNLAVTATEGQVRFYKNGELQSEFAVGDSNITFGDTFWLGSYWGYAKQLKIWDFALTQEQLQIEMAVANSTAQVPVHQWLMDEGVGSVMSDTGSVGGANIDYPNVTIWKHANSPYEILLESEIKVYDSEKPLPGTELWGSADFDQDGVNEVFIHAGNDDYLGQPIPMLVLQVDENNQLNDKSADLIDGGLYYRYFGSGRKTVVADFNNDGYDDIFAPAYSTHFGVTIPEPSILLMSDGASGRLFPADDRIKSPPCTLIVPAYEGQKPCQTSDAAGLKYPDESAELVDMEIRSYGHGADVADIDGDGDLDLLVITVFGAERDELPVSSYFLINDGNGNFTANWQLMPHKAATYYTEWFEEGELPGMEPGEFYPKDEYYSFGVLRDFDVDGHLDMALLRIYAFAATLRPPDGPFDVETENAWQSVYELIAWGSAEGFSEEYTILESVGLPSDAYRGTNTEPLPMDIDGDGDLDLIVNRDGAVGGLYPASYLQIFRNEGGRVFADVTAELLPQEMADISTRPYSASLKEHDLNQDGCPDFIAMQDYAVDNLNGLPPFRIWLNDCIGRFTQVRDSLFGKVGLMIPLDLDNDGGLDFVSINRGVDDGGRYKEATILKQVAPIDVTEFAEPWPIVYPEYDCRAKDIIYASNFEAMPAHEIIITSNASGIITEIGQTLGFTVELLNEQGAVTDSSSLEWCLTDTEHLELIVADGTATVTASSMGTTSAQLVVRDPASGEEARATVIFAELRDDAFLLNDTVFIDGITPPNGATGIIVLQRTDFTETLMPGMVIASGDRLGILVRILEVTVLADRVELLVEPAGLHEFYSRVRIEAESVPKRFRIVNDGGEMSQLQMLNKRGSVTQSFNLFGFECEFDVLSPSSIPTFDVEFITTEFFVYEMIPGINLPIEMEIISSGRARAELDFGVEVKVGPQIDCKIQNISALPVAAFPAGPIPVLIQVKPVPGFSGSVTAGESLFRLPTPVLMADLGWAAGLRWDIVNGFDAVFSNSAFRANWGWELREPRDPESFEYRVDFKPYIGANIGVGVIPSGPQFDLLTYEYGVPMTAGINVPLDWKERNYVGPSWKVEHANKFEFADDVLNVAEIILEQKLGLLGASVAMQSIDPVLYSNEFTWRESPSNPTLSAVCQPGDCPVDPARDDWLSWSLVFPPGYDQGEARAALVGWKDGAVKAVELQSDPVIVDGADGQWYPESADIGTWNLRGMVWDRDFFNIGNYFPYPTVYSTTDYNVGTSWQLNILLSGGGKVTSAPLGVNCLWGNYPTDCSAEFADGTDITLTAHDVEGYVFTGWQSGAEPGYACEGSDSKTCAFKMTKDTFAWAGYEAVSLVSVAVEKVSINTNLAAPGGLVTSSTPGIDCGSQCTGAFPAAGTLALTASNADGWNFRYWTAPEECATEEMRELPTCEVNLDGPALATAVFEPDPVTMTSHSIGAYYRLNERCISLPENRSAYATLSGTYTGTVEDGGYLLTWACVDGDADGTNDSCATKSEARIEDLGSVTPTSLAMEGWFCWGDSQSVITNYWQYRSPTGTLSNTVSARAPQPSW